MNHQMTAIIKMGTSDCAQFDWLSSNLGVRSKMQKIYIYIKGTVEFTASQIFPVSADTVIQKIVKYNQKINR